MSFSSEAVHSEETKSYGPVMSSSFPEVKRMRNTETYDIGLKP
eukprot:IDg20057t1